MKKIAVVGSRTGINPGYVDTILHMHFRVDEDLCRFSMISGGAVGVDSYAEDFAEYFDIPCEIFLPDWKRHGKSAGFIRNQRIVQECDELICFWDGQSKGAKMSYDLAVKMKKSAIMLIP